MFIAQIVAVTIFLIMFIMLLLEKVERHYVTLGCALLTLVVVFAICLEDLPAVWHTINLESFTHLGFWHSSGGSITSSGINWETLMFIGGMMVMVEGMAISGFFRWLCITIAKKVNYRPIPIFIIFMLLSFVLSMFIDSITVIMFLAAVTAELAKLLKITPLPMILAEIFCANLGGSATMCGDPPNIIIGTALGYSFFDFLLNTGLIAVVSLVVVIPYFYLFFRKKLVAQVDETAIVSFPSPAEAIRSKKDFLISCIIFAIAVVLLVSHGATGLTVSSIGIFVAILTLIAAGKGCWKLLKRLDWETLLFFMGLFVVVAGLEETGILTLLANWIGKLSGGNAYITITIILWLSGIASAFIDNIPFAATMIPVIRSLSALTGVDLNTLAWSLSMGTDIGGCATPIGASANVVGTAIAAKNGFPVTWGRYCKALAPITVLVMVISTLIIFVRYL